MANRNRTAGHDWEREVVNKLKDIGFDDAITSRMESKAKDDAGIDICNTPGFNIQCKCTSLNPNYHELIQNMPDDAIRAVFHKKTVKSAKGRFMAKGEYAVVRLEDFLRMMKRYQRKKTHGKNTSSGS